ncbi:MAG: gliding motility-associated C-terminal domain-containing protein, partial [Winogradskyella sp.]|uniref:T9SS type B sorting domain-containing protein n=1 Tax=Winogradskyella sp. TaxID=1883156 RepID=UPI000F3E5A18
VNVTISPEPILSTTLDATVCSDDVSGIVLDVEPGSIAAATYNIIAINDNGLVASAGAPVVGNGFGANEIADDAYTNMTNAPVVVTYTIVPVSADNCDGNPFDVNLTIDPAPAPNLGPHEIRVCDDDPTQILVELFNLTQLEAVIFDGNLDLSAVYFRTLQDAIDRVNGIPDPMNYPNIDPVETIYVRVENSFDCFTIVEIEIEVFALPDASVDVTDWLVCENDTDFLFDFELNSKIPEILGPSQSETDFEVTFYSTQIAADTQDPTFLLDGNSHQNVGNPQPIFVVIRNRTTDCIVSSQSFNIEVQDGADANPVFYEECDVVNDNDGSTQFDLESQIPLILGPAQSLADFNVDFYADFDDAFDGNTNTLPLLYENIEIPTQIIYARVSNVLRPDECFDIAEITLQVNLLPIVNLEPDYILCLNSTPEAVVDIPPIIDTGLLDTDYTFIWSLDGDVLASATGSSLDPTSTGEGLYSVLVTNNNTGCNDTFSTTVTESALPDSFDVSWTTETFSGNNIITVSTSGISTYEYSLDNGPWQLNNEFTNVTGGLHTVFVRDINGCGMFSEDIVIIDYPKFFTPNGDGTNDTWKISGIETQAAAVIYIYDRYGKLLKQLSPTSQGWDGTYNGNPMPSNDYWFTLEYRENLTNETRTLSSHFSLKR